MPGTLIQIALLLLVAQTPTIPPTLDTPVGTWYSLEHAVDLYRAGGEQMTEAATHVLAGMDNPSTLPLVGRCRQTAVIHAHSDGTSIIELLDSSTGVASGTIVAEETGLLGMFYTRVIVVQFTEDVVSGVDEARLTMRAHAVEYDGITFCQGGSTTDVPRLGDEVVLLLRPDSTTAIANGEVVPGGERLFYRSLKPASETRCIRNSVGDYDDKGVLPLQCESQQGARP